MLDGNKGDNFRVTDNVMPQDYNFSGDYYIVNTINNSYNKDKLRPIFINNNFVIIRVKFQNSEFGLYVYGLNTKEYMAWDDLPGHYGYDFSNLMSIQSDDTIRLVDSILD